MNYVPSSPTVRKWNRLSFIHKISLSPPLKQGKPRQDLSIKDQSSITTFYEVKCQKLTIMYLMLPRYMTTHLNRFNQTMIGCHIPQSVYRPSCPIIRLFRIVSKFVYCFLLNMVFTMFQNYDVIFCCTCLKQLKLSHDKTNQPHTGGSSRGLLLRFSQRFLN